MPLLEGEFAAETDRAKTVARRVIAGYESNERARKAFAGRYLLNTLSNIPTIAAEGDVAALFDLFKGVPAVVIGAGPSLDRNLETLPRLVDRALVIAVDTAVRPLLAAGLHPHLIVSVDPSDLNARHLADLPDTRGMWLVGEGSLDSRVLPQFRHRTFTFKVSDHEPWPWLTAQGFDRGKLDAWGSVLTTAFDLALRAGCDPIVFAGADLAYTRGLQYCRNTIYEADWSPFPTDAERADVFFRLYLKTRPHLRVPDVAGQEVVTAPQFLQFRDWIVSRARTANRQILNATGGGILRDGSIRQTDIAQFSLPPLSAEQRDVHSYLGAAWTHSAGHRPVAALAQALSAPAALPIARWLDFGGDTAPVEQIVDTCATVAAGLNANFAQ
jgi:hypothetical protein